MNKSGSNKCLSTTIATCVYHAPRNSAATCLLFGGALFEEDSIVLVGPTPAAGASRGFRCTSRLFHTQSVRLLTYNLKSTRMFERYLSLPTDTLTGWDGVDWARAERPQSNESTGVMQHVQLCYLMNLLLALDRDRRLGRESMHQPVLRHTSRDWLVGRYGPKCSVKCAWSNAVSNAGLSLSSSSMRQFWHLFLAFRSIKFMRLFAV
jgi:hypothetical protein